MKKVVTRHELEQFLGDKALVRELKEIAKILKCQKLPNKKTFASLLTKKLYKYYQTPVGNKLRNPTLDSICDKAAKKLKLRPLEGSGWVKLHSLSVNIFEKILNSMTKKEKKKLFKELLEKISEKERKRLHKEFKAADLEYLMEHSELFAAHIIGIHLARELALYTAAAVLKVNLTAEVALAASKVLTRTATVFLGPVGWGLALVSVNDLMGTNFKVVIPALMTINTANIRVHRGISKQLDIDLSSIKIPSKKSRPKAAIL